MTREEIKTITDIVHKTIYTFFDVCGDDEEVPMSEKDKLLLSVNKAICKSIRALEQEPCGDAISRQAVLDLIEHYNSDGLGSVFYGYEEGVKFADAVNKLPSVNPQEPKTRNDVNEDTGLKLDEAIKRYASNAEFERTHGNLQGCLEFSQLAKWLRELKMYRHYLLKAEVEPQESEDKEDVFHCWEEVESEET